jgi:hypothetical protein
MYQTQSTEKDDTSQVSPPATLNAHALSTLFEKIALVHRLRRLNDSKFTIHTVVVCRYATYTDREQI